MKWKLGGNCVWGQFIEDFFSCHLQLNQLEYILVNHDVLTAYIFSILSFKIYLSDCNDW